MSSSIVPSAILFEMCLQSCRLILKTMAVFHSPRRLWFLVEIALQKGLVYWLLKIIHRLLQGVKTTSKIVVSWLPGWKNSATSIASACWLLWLRHQLPCAVVCKRGWQTKVSITMFYNITAAHLRGGHNQRKCLRYSTIHFCQGSQKKPVIILMPNIFEDLQL